MKGKHFCVTLKNGKFPMKYECKYMHEVLGCIEGIANSVSGRGFIYPNNKCQPERQRVRIRMLSRRR